MGVGEGVGRERMALARAPGREQLPTEPDEDAEPTGGGARRGGYRVAQVPRAVAVRGVGGPLRPGEDDGPVVVVEQVEEERGLLGGVRAVGDDDARDVRVAQLRGDRLGERVHPVQRHAEPAHGEHVLDADLDPGRQVQPGDEVGAGVLRGRRAAVRRIGWRSFRRSPARSRAARATSTSIGCRDPIQRGPPLSPRPRLHPCGPSSCCPRAPRTWPPTASTTRSSGSPACRRERLHRDPHGGRAAASAAARRLRRRHRGRQPVQLQRPAGG